MDKSQSNSNDRVELLDEREAQYGQAWETTGVILGGLRVDLYKMIHSSSWLSFNWIMILNKLTRALKTPNDKDHWRDIIGYAQLVLNRLEEEEDVPDLSGE